MSCSPTNLRRSASPALTSITVGQRSFSLAQDGVSTGAAPYRLLLTFGRSGGGRWLSKTRERMSGRS